MSANGDVCLVVNQQYSLISVTSIDRVHILTAVFSFIILLITQLLKILSAWASSEGKTPVKNINEEHKLPLLVLHELSIN